MENIKIFENSEFGAVRTVTINNEPYFVGKDIAEILGYSNATKAVIMHVDEEDKRKEMLNAESQNGIVVTETTVINESGLYSLVLGSKLPTAKKFKRWVTSEVLPDIRKNGMYATESTVDKMLENPDAFIEMIQKYKAEKASRIKAEQRIEEMRPKEIFADAVATSKTSILIGDLAKLISQNGYPIGSFRLFNWLRDNKYLCSSGSQRNMPMQRYVEQGLFEVKESSVQNPDGSVRITKTTKVTGKGQCYFINKFAEIGRKQVEN